MSALDAEGGPDYVESPLDLTPPKGPDARALGAEVDGLNVRVSKDVSAAVDLGASVPTGAPNVENAAEVLSDKDLLI